MALTSRNFVLEQIILPTGERVFKRHAALSINYGESAVGIASLKQTSKNSLNQQKTDKIYKLL